MSEKYDLNNLPKEKFVLATDVDRTHDVKFDTKPIGYLADAWRRFKKNKASVAALIIIIFLLIFAALGPLFIPRNYTKAYVTDKYLMRYQYLNPRLKFMGRSGIWDGSKKLDISEATYLSLKARGVETGKDPVEYVIKEYQTGDDIMGYTNMKVVKVNTYYNIDIWTLTLIESEYLELQEWQNEHNIQLILPYSENNKNNFNIWYKIDERLTAVLDENGNFIPNYLQEGEDLYDSLRLEADPYNSGDIEHRWRYAKRSGLPGQFNYVVRIDPYEYFIYKYGFEPAFAFGTDSNGYDIFTRLASGARFSLLLAILVSAINLTIGAIYGAIEGYYGGVTDLIMERISDILADIPFMVVTILFQLHLGGKIGVIPALIYAFVLTGWIGMAGRVRMQFYRFKNQEYILAARTLGAKDWRIMFKHIFPNSLGTIITGSVLVIPGVIFSETSLTYLGIINLDSPTMSSVGAMLSNGQGQMAKYPFLILFPSLFIALLMISFNLFGNGLRDAFNPSLRGTDEE